ncbi:armadillo repeat-containing X-linked protein 1 isoform X4 [Mesocricetus auratus]|uniref:Armadillo repeat-containing X-linked protein 1 isoform X4 n=1 Tax=Mesocricetus auratus TaxID=10036 RepID=A0ABM2XC01_MESAU|nr:armadillo repeat-containing X-linked protein 1 isoform X4 [Mesocricetus auratus]
MPAECSTFWSKGIIDIEFLHVSLKLRLPKASVSVGLAPEDQSKRRSRGRRKNFLNQICKSLEKRKGLLGCKGDPVTLTQDVWKGKDHRSPCICCVSCSYLQELKTLP